MKLRTDKQRGFTLIELLVSMFILGLLSSVVLISSFSGQKRYDLLRVVQQMSADLRQAQTLAISGTMQGGASPSGYGFYLSDSSHYVIFYNSSSDKQYNGASVVIKTVVLPESINASVASNGVYFVPPEPLTYINGDNSGSLAITLGNGTETRTITIYSTGRIEQ